MQHQLYSSTCLPPSFPSFFPPSHPLRMRMWKPEVNSQENPSYHIGSPDPSCQTQTHAPLPAEPSYRLLLVRLLCQLGELNLGLVKHSTTEPPPPAKLSTLLMELSPSPWPSFPCQVPQKPLNQMHPASTLRLLRDKLLFPLVATASSL